MRISCEKVEPETCPLPSSEEDEVCVKWRVEGGDISPKITAHALAECAGYSDDKVNESNCFDFRCDLNFL